MTQKYLRKVWTKALCGARGGERGRVVGEDSQGAFQQAAEPVAVTPGWVSKPQSRSSFLAPSEMCECPVTPSSLLTRRARMSPNHEVVWQCRFFSCPNLQPSRGSSPPSPCQPMLGCAWDKLGSYPSSVPTVGSHPPREIWFSAVLPHPSTHDGCGNGEAEPTCWGPLRCLCPNSSGIAALGRNIICKAPY